MVLPEGIKYGDVVEVWNITRENSCFGYYKGKNQWGGYMISKYRASKAREAFSNIKKVEVDYGRYD